MTDVSPPMDSAARGDARWLGGVDVFSKALAAVACVATALLMLNVIADVIGRAFFNRPLPGTLDVTQYAWMPSLVSLALGYALLRGEHIRVSLLTGPAGPRTQRVIEVIGMAVTLIVVALFIWFGAEKAFESMSGGERAVGSPWLVIWPYRLVLIVGLVGLFLQAAAQLVRAIVVKEFVPADENEAAELLESEEGLLDGILDEARVGQTEVRR